MPLDMPTETAIRFPLLCRAWGETDLPGVRIVNSMTELSEFLIAEWLGKPGPDLDDVMLELHDPAVWDAGTSGMVAFEFEIGGVSLERVYHSGSAGEPPQRLLDLADRIDHEKLCLRAGLEREKWEQEQRDRCDAGVHLRRYADLLGSKSWRIYPPSGIPTRFSAGTLDDVVAMAKRDESRR